MSYPINCRLSHHNERRQLFCTLMSRIWPSTGTRRAQTIERPVFFLQYTPIKKWVCINIIVNFAYQKIAH